MICKNCGYDTPDGFVFCRTCGAKLDYSQKQGSRKPKRSGNIIFIIIFIAIICGAVFGVNYLKKAFNQSNDIEKLVKDKQTEKQETSNLISTNIETLENGETIVSNINGNGEKNINDVEQTNEVEEILKEVEEIKEEIGTRTFADITGVGTLYKGTKVKFGSYVQDGEDAKKTPINWRVLTIKDNCALLLCDTGLDCKKYCNFTGNAWYGKSTLRAWLNDDFFNTAFSQEEKACIVKHRVGTSKNKTTGVRTGDAVYDYVAIPSEGEFDSYLEGSKNRMAQASAYAISKGAHGSLEEDYFLNGYYWLRNSGVDHSTAMVVDPHGVPNPFGISVKADNVLVRPEIWVRIN